MRGRVGSLLEVGTGFHPELTGRENIFLNGAILGLSRAEINARFDEIVDFSGVERFLDTAVKHYSSGMYLRLAFGVAAHLEPEILIIDEVLAVGDAGFQSKCLGKMQSLAGSGRTVLFVSHNMSAVRALCERVLVLGDGMVEADTLDISHGISRYAGVKCFGSSWERPSDGSKPLPPLYFRKLSLSLRGEQPRLSLEITTELVSDSAHEPALLAFDITDSSSVPIMQAMPFSKPFVNPSTAPILMTTSIDLPPLVPGTYRVVAWVGAHYTSTYDYLLPPVLEFSVISSPDLSRSFPHSPDHGLVVPPSTVRFHETP